MIESEYKLSLMDMEERFRIECLRKNHSGYYVIISQEDGGRAFVFMDENLIPYDI